jgi:adenylosuccinate synthase
LSGTAIIGLQWGDEAKGKVVDIYTEQSDIVVRYQGGSNAGHTVVKDGKKFKLSLIPSGIFHPEVQCVITGGVALDVSQILREIDELRSQGIEIGKNLMISDRAHLIFPWHGIEDRIFDSIVGNEAIGSTKRGIGPCYRDKVGRSLAVRLGDLYRPTFRQRLETIVEFENSEIKNCLSDSNKESDIPLWDFPFEVDKIHREFIEYAERLRPFVADTTSYLLDAVDADKRMLFEGAQGSLLDIDHGTFPYVTSSNSSGVGVPGGSGVPCGFIRKIIGILKAYTTRVGGGPFPTEQDNEIGQRIRDRGNEYGTITRRPRRCGWFDAVAARYTVRLAGAGSLALMLLDVLSGFDELHICTAYELDGKRITHFPGQIEDLRNVVPVYETLPGWKEEITEIRRFVDLPENTRRYVARISELLGKPIEIVSVGPDRLQTIVV